jgi:hypothetical protein
MLLMLCVAQLVVPLAARAVDAPLVPAQELHARDGLPNFFAKVAKSGSELKVGYLGGSITAQPGWRVKSLALLQKTYPEVKFKEINAALGGTGSDLGVFRVQPEVLDLKPDLLFVEFAVNDGGSAPEQIIRSMEGIVRKTWNALPDCDICFVYTVTEALVGPMLEGQFPRAASVMEQVADHYGIPTIHMGMEVARLAKEGTLLWKAKLPVTPEEKAAVEGKFVFAPDTVHPHVETGHVLYAQAIERALPGVKEASKEVVPHSLKTPMVADNYEGANMLPITDATLSNGMKALDPADALAMRFPRLKTWHSAKAAGDSLTFKFRGTRAAVYQIVGPDVGQVRVTVDDKPAKMVTVFDAYCTSHRLNTLLVGTDLPDAEHTVRVEVSGEAPDKAAILAKREQKVDKPERFSDNGFYPGALLIVGELVK